MNVAIFDHVLKVELFYVRHVKFWRKNQMFRMWSARWPSVVMSMASFMTFWSCLRSEENHRTQTICSWVTTSTVAIIALRLSRCLWHSRWCFIFHLYGFYVRCVTLFKGLYADMKLLFFTVSAVNAAKYFSSLLLKSVVFSLRLVLVAKVELLWFIVSWLPF